MIFDISADQEKSDKNKLLLQKLNLVLVQVRVLLVDVGYCFNNSFHC